MSAQLKTRVLVREEKGLGSISMKRVIGAAMGGGAVFMLIRFTPLNFLSLPAFLVGAIMTLYLTGQRFGLPRYRYLTMTWRANLILDAASPDGLSARLCTWLNIDPSGARIAGEDVFDFTIELAAGEDWSGWEIVEDVAFIDEGGLQLVHDSADVIVLSLPASTPGESHGH